MILSFGNLCAQKPGTKPQNYDELKSLLTTLTRGRRPSVEWFDAFEALKTRKDGDIPALLLLFEEETDDRYRGRITEAILKSKVSKASKREAADVLFRELESLDVKEWEGNAWVTNAIGILAEGDPEQARWAAWQVLSLPMDFDSNQDLPNAALKALGEVGTMEDAERLKESYNKDFFNDLLHKFKEKVMRKEIDVSDIEVDFNRKVTQKEVDDSDIGKTIKQITERTAKQKSAAKNVPSELSRESSPITTTANSSPTVNTEPAESSSPVWLITLAVAFLAGLGYVFYRRK